MPHSRECLIHFTWDLAVYTVVTCHFVGLSSAIYRTLWQVRGSFRHISETLLALHRLIPGSKGTKIVGMWGPSFMVLLEFVVRFNLSRRIFSTNTLLRLFIYLIVYNLQNFINFFFYGNSNKTRAFSALRSSGSYESTACFVRFIIAMFLRRFLATFSNTSRSDSDSL